MLFSIETLSVSNQYLDKPEALKASVHIAVGYSDLYLEVKYIICMICNGHVNVNPAVLCT